MTGSRGSKSSKFIKNQFSFTIMTWPRVKRWNDVKRSVAKCKN